MMSKIRVYELAKELGVDNKVIATRAAELGIRGKLSHSSSLDSDEADAVRRAIIRQAMGASSASETITRRVDRTTGTTDTVVERRKGDVIRRRRKIEVEPEVVAQEVAAPEIQEEIPTQVEAVDIEEVATPVESAPVPEIELVEVDASQVRAEPLESEEVEEVPSETVEETPTEGEDTGKKVGPKVLGRIVLPARKGKEKDKVVPPSKETKKQFASPVPIGRDVEEEDDDEQAQRKGRLKKAKRREFSRVDLLDYDGREGRRSPRSGKTKKDDQAEQALQPEAQRMRASKRVVKMGDSITVNELSRQMSVKAGDVIAKLIELGVMATINQLIDKDIATIVAEEFEYTIESTSFDEASIIAEEVEETEEGREIRPPVVTVMGHVDHGKTSLLDYIRKTSVAQREQGGITQHIGAYQVEINGKLITFIDTPGHAAFTSMRARGANVTDIVVLVVAADDGVMPQTVEAINHAQAANVPIVVAVNKMDKPGVNPDRVKQQLSERGLSPEDWGGETMYFNVSALKGMGISELLEGLLLLAEIKELKANVSARARGTIIETRQDRGRGIVATALVQNGTLRVGDAFVSGCESGRVRSMTDDKGNRIGEAGPSTPVELTGFDDLPLAGDDFIVLENESQARQVASNRKQKRSEKEERALGTGAISLEEFSRRANNILLAELAVILKADVQGSAEAVRDSIEKLSTEKVKVRVIHSAVGGVTESDVQLAIASRAIIVGFNVRAEPRVLTEAEQSRVEIRFYRVIYELIDDVKKAMAGLLEPIKEEVSLGRAEVRQTFTVPKMGTIAGSYVMDGLIKRGAFVRLVRDSRVIYEGKMGSLRRFKDDVREVQSGYECGIGIDGYNDIKPGDEIQVFEVKETAQTLD